MSHLVQIRRAPVYALGFIASLAIGIAAACTAFAVVKRAFIDPLPYPESDRLLTIRTVTDGRASLSSSFQFGEALKGAAVFDDIAADWGATVTYEAPGRSERVSGGAVTPNYFDVLGIRPALGTTLTAGAQDEVVVSWAFFERALSGDPAALGKPIALDGIMRRVVGVMPNHFVAPYLTEARLWIPLDTTRFMAESARGSRGVILQTRLADGASLADAKTYLDVFAAQQHRQYPEAFARQAWVVDPLQHVLVEPSRTLLIATAVATVLLMVVVLTNIAGLAAARAMELRRPAAVRLALGASRATLFRERIVESTMLAAIGLAAGLWLATLFVEWVVGYQQQFQLFLEDVPAAQFDGVIAMIGVLLGLAAAAVAAIVPQRAMMSLAAGDLLGNGRGFGTPRLARTRSTLVVAQVAMTVVLLFSAGLLVRTVQSMTSAPIGFNSADLATFTVMLPAARYQAEAQSRYFEEELLRRLRGIPGIEAAASTVRFPTQGGPNATITLPGRGAVEDTRAVYFTVAPGFFEFLRTPLREGREFAPTDAGDTPPVVVINETMARTFWPSGGALGARFRLGMGATGADVTVVGIAPDVRQDGWGQEIRPTVYESTTQRASLTRAFVIRFSRPTTQLAPDVRAAVHAVDSLLAMSLLTPVDVRLASQIVQQRFVRSLLMIFAAVASGLCTLGMFAVVSLAAQARRREFATRMALGAQFLDVAWLVMRQSLALGIIGTLIGFLASTWLTGALRAMLHGVTLTDPATLATTVGAILLLALVAGLPVALRAARTDPVTVLKAN